MYFYSFILNLIPALGNLLAASFREDIHGVTHPSLDEAIFALFSLYDVRRPAVLAIFVQC